MYIDLLRIASIFRDGQGSLVYICRPSLPIQYECCVTPNYQVILNLNMDDIAPVSMSVPYPAGTAPVKQE